MSETKGWHFKKNSEVVGWNDGTLAHFDGDPLRSLVREMIQNPLDRRLDKNKPLTVNFAISELNRRNIPAIDDLSRALEKVVLFATEREPQFLDRIKEAHKKINKQDFKVLEVADYNSTGMPGKWELDGTFFTYMNSQGSASGGQNREGLGSKGHGKVAPLVNTPIRTIFASTVWQSDQGRQFFCMGKSHLMTHSDDGSKDYESFRHPIGHYGILGENLPKPLSEPPGGSYEWLSRDKPGSSIHIIDFHHGSPQSLWSSAIAGLVCINWFPAILEDKLVVKTDNVTIDRNTLRDLFSDKKINNY